MSEVSLGACAGFLLGGSGTCSLVGGAGFYACGGQGCARGLRTTLANLSVDEWGCVPILSVVWPEVSQH